ncbi:MAG: hypothetical protein ACI9GW_001656 [Halieaceae bacterium]
MVLLAAASFIIAVCLYNLRAKIALDAVDKHGISSSAATRCGGIAIWVLPRNIARVSGRPK